MNTVECVTFLKKEICEAAVRLIADCRDFGETGEMIFEDDCISIQVFPVGLAAAPDKLENETVLLKIADRDPGGAAFCYASYTIYPKSPSGRARMSSVNRNKCRRYAWSIPL